MCHDVKRVVNDQDLYLLPVRHRRHLPRRLFVLAAAYRDAIRLANRGQSKVMLRTEEGWVDPDLTKLRNVLYSKCDVVVVLQGGRHRAKILKTKLKE